jgi:hypothetical protein
MAPEVQAAALEHQATKGAGLEEDRTTSEARIHYLLCLARSSREPTLLNLTPSKTFKKSITD